MTEDKLKQIITLFGGFLSALLLFFQAIQFDVTWFNDEFINALVGTLMAGVPLLVALYAVWKNTYVMTKKARAQEAKLKEEGLK